MSETIVRLPPNTVTLSPTGRVLRFVEWVNFEGTAHRSVFIERKPNGSFLSFIQVLNGGGRREGPLFEVLRPLDEATREGITQLFETMNPNLEDFKKYGFGGYTLERSPDDKQFTP